MQMDYVCRPHHFNCLRNKFRHHDAAAYGSGYVYAYDPHPIRDFSRGICGIMPGCEQRYRMTSFRQMASQALRIGGNTTAMWNIVVEHLQDIHVSNWPARRLLVDDNGVYQTRSRAH